MADIELVIKIPEGLKKDFELEQWTALSCMEMKNALTNGTQIPKGHGRLIDADALKEVYETTEDAEYCRWTLYGVTREIDDAETIIEADKRGKKNANSN